MTGPERAAQDPATPRVAAYHDRWDATLDAVLTVPSGGQVLTETTFGGRRLVTRQDLTALLEMGGPDGDRMALAGPIRVIGARPGDAVRIDLIGISVDAWGYTRVQPGVGLLGDEIEHDTVVAWDLSDGRFARPVDDALARRGVTVPIRPFAGVIGLAPSGPPRGTRAPGRHGGNLDVRKLIAGASVWLPVAVEGALLSIGDLHAAQGSGEIGGTAIETSGEVTARVSVASGRDLRAPAFTTPTPHPDGHIEAYCCTGIGPDLMEAARDAVRDLTRHVARALDVDFELAHALCSVSADLAIEEIVDRPDWVVSACIPGTLLGTTKPSRP